MCSDLGELVEVLQAAPDWLDWSVRVHEGETHQTMPIPALRRALPITLNAPDRPSGV